MNAVDRMNSISYRFDRIQTLRNQANAMIEEVLPHHWSDGDVRYIESGLYYQIHKLLIEACSLELGPDYDRLMSHSAPIKELTYLGQFGTITIKRAE